MKRRIILGLLVISMVCCVGCEKNVDTQSNNSEYQNNNTNIELDSEISNDNLSNDVVLSIEVLMNAEETSQDEFVYFSFENEVYITEFIGNSEIVVIPNEIDGMPVVEISNTAFRNCTQVKGVRISDNVIRIGDSAFANCSSLEYVVFGKNVESVGEYAFASNPNVIEFILNEGLLTVGNMAICEAKIPVIIPKSVIEIGESGFRQPVQVYSGSYGEEYILNYVANFDGEFIYEIIE